jgi:hypothetical protein
MYVFMIHVYYHAWSSLTDKPDLQRWERGRRLRGMSCILIRCTYNTNLEMIQP